MKKTITYKEIKDKVLDIINNGGGGGGKSKLSELNDVTITSASDGQVLKYNGTKWVNGAAGGGGTKIITYVGNGGVSSPSVELGNATLILAVYDALDYTDKHFITTTKTVCHDFPITTTDTLTITGYTSDWGSVMGTVSCTLNYNGESHTAHFTGGQNSADRFNTEGRNYCIVVM